MATNSTDARQVLEEEKARLRKLHPTPDDIPSCMSLLETFLNCNGISSQFRSWYREGEIATCEPKLNEVKFCFSLRSFSPEEKREAWINRRAEWWTRRRLAKSSEDVWAIRNEPLQNWPAPYDPAHYYGVQIQ